MKKYKIYILLVFLASLSCHSHINSVEILYYGHSCFEFNYENYRILIDPFTPEWFDYVLPEGQFDMVFSSHDAKDHSYFEGFNMKKLHLASGATDEFKIIMNADSSVQKGRITESTGKKKFSYWTVPSFHDEVQGQRNGVNGIICFDFDGIKIVHMGDIGHILEEKQIQGIGKVDILMTPVDSYYIIPLENAREIVNQLSPTIVIPMHFKTEKSSNKAYKEDLDTFAKMFKNVNKYNNSRLKVTRQKLNVEPHLLILAYLSED
jgi:L-ascorbate metabolism protein UlaG (beta-lactamase superfamily)